MNNTCIDAFKNLNITYAGHRLGVSPCCISPAVPVEQIDHNDPYLVEIRKAWSNGQLPSACTSCHVAESRGNASRRHGSNQWYKDNGHYNTEVELIRLDYWTGDLCNLRCVICGPENSSSWKEELKFPAQLKKSSVNKFWKSLDLTKLKFVHFNGGEPLLSKEHVEFLEAIPNKEQVHINYNTNGTIRPSASLMELWLQFRLVQLDFSIDDIGERFEYQRYPAKWNDVTENLKWFVDTAPHNCMFAVNTSVGILNQSNIHNLNAWLQENFSVSRFTDPIEHRQQQVFGNFAVSRNLEHVKILLNEIDRRRGTNWRRTFPELSNTSADHSKA